MLQTILTEPGDLRVEERPTPEPGPGELVLKVDALTICGSDVRVFTGEKTGGVKWPATIGHEIAGRVAAIGSGVKGYAEGDAVSVAPWFVCGHCAYCRRGDTNLCAYGEVLGYGIPGGLAEYVVIPAQAVALGLVFANDPELAPEIRALAEPLACTLHGHLRSRIGIESRVLVIGGGPIGLLHVALARLAGARQVIVSEPSAARREFAATVGADTTIDPTAVALDEAVMERTDGEGADATIVCIGYTPLVDDAIKATRKGGVVNLFAGFGAPGRGEIDLNMVHYRQQDVIGNSGATTNDYAQALELIESGQLDLTPFITHRMPLAEAPAAMETARGGDAIKVAVLC